MSGTTETQRHKEKPQKQNVYAAFLCVSVSLWFLTYVSFAIPSIAAERWNVGLAPKGSLIEAMSVPGNSNAAPTVLLIGGLNGNDESARVVAQEVRAFEATGANRRTFRLIAIPLANPENSPLVFPPSGIAYRDNPESHALWRWIAIHGPDLVLIASDDDHGLAQALAQNAVAGVGRIPAERVAAKSGLLQSVLTRKGIAKSEAHNEIDRRRGRSARQLAGELAQYYGHEFNDLTYIPGMGLVGQLRLGRIADVEALVAPWVDGPKAAPPGRPASNNLSGYLVFAELAQRTGDARYAQMVRTAAGVGFTETGEMKESMPSSNDMSDSVFMSIPILGEAARLTGDRKYCDMAARHLAFMQKLDLRPDGLYRHSPTSEDAAWGRGNAFPALGLALTLSSCPKDHAQFGYMLKEFQQHLSKLAPFQDREGLWHEVVDVPGSYAEFTATAMIGVAMLRGVHNGWLYAASYQPRIEKAWQAILTRVGANGELMDVCESTNKQKTLQDYLHREAILGRDIRGGGMALLFATEMAGIY
jgi:unsaturated rhamnogalacturonyl hydrolase